MLASFLLSLREGLEAALIIGIVLGVLSKLKRANLKKNVWQGTGMAAGLSVVAAIVLNLFGMEFEGKGEQVFEGAAMLLAAAVLTWMIFWMREHSGNLRSEIEEQTNLATRGNGQKAMFTLAFLAVFREGVELALFLLATRMASDPLQTLAGALSGLAAATIFGWALFTSTMKLSLRKFFTATNVLLIIFAAGMVGLGVHEFNEAGIIPAMIEHVWNLKPILSDEGGIGLVLKALVGYSDSPSLASVIGYTVYLAGVATFILSRKQVVVPNQPQLIK